MALPAKGIEIIDDRERLLQCQRGSITPVIAMFTVQVADLRDMPLKGK
jgi:hypothetical protein